MMAKMRVNQGLFLNFLRGFAGMEDIVITVSKKAIVHQALWNDHTMLRSGLNTETVNPVMNRVVLPSVN